MLHVYQHPSGTLLHVDFTPPSPTEPQVILNAVHLASDEYRPVGPNLLHFLHGTYIVTVGTNEASPMLQAISEEVACLKTH